MARVAASQRPAPNHCNLDLGSLYLVRFSETILTNTRRTNMAYVAKCIAQGLFVSALKIGFYVGGSIALMAYLANAHQGF